MDGCQGSVEIKRLSVFNHQESSQPFLDLGLGSGGWDFVEFTISRDKSITKIFIEKLPGEAEESKSDL